MKDAAFSDSKDGWGKRKATGTDIANAYRMFLGREAESVAVIEDRVGQFLQDVAAGFLLSQELLDKLGVTPDGVLEGTDPALLQIPDANLLAWADDHFAADFGTVSRNDGRDHRLRLISALLSSAEIRSAEDRSADPAALGGAIARTLAAADVIRDNPLFDKDIYIRQLDDGASVADPALHYVLWGEQSLLFPSATLVAKTYAQLYPDIEASAANRLLHFAQHGSGEGRPDRASIGRSDLPTERIDPAKPTVLLIFHEGTHTGAPILGWNLARELKARCNVVAVMRGGGTMDAAITDATAATVGPLNEAAFNPMHLTQLARRLVWTYQPLYAIANSVESGGIAMALRDAGVPIVALVHEFSTGRPASFYAQFYKRCSALVFPSEIVRKSSIRVWPNTAIQRSYIYPQGPSDVPPFGGSAAADVAVPLERFIEDTGNRSLADVLAEPRDANTPFTVVGLGTVEARKGLDLFVAAGTALRARHPDLRFRMIWIGSWKHALSTEFASFLEEQVERSGLGASLHFYPATERLEEVYALADALFLSSRLDPLPNVSIDAALRGIPIVCFRDASGIAEILLQDPETAGLVAPHLDSGGAAAILAEMALDPARQRVLSAAVRRVGRATFDMAEYARKIEALGEAAVSRDAALDSDEQVIAASGLFDPLLCFGSADAVAALPPGISPERGYLLQTRHLDFTRSFVPGCGIRRPTPGFHPFLYAASSSSFVADGARDALAHFIESGSPAGPWLHPVIRLPEATAGRPPRATGLPLIVERAKSTFDRLVGRIRRPAAGAPRIALHGHFHYTDDIGALLAALAVNGSAVDLYLTATNTAGAKALARATRRYRGGSVVIETGNNIGRDIGPFLRVLKQHLAGRYDIIGHVHGKKSFAVDTGDGGVGERWRRFLWEHLIGPTYPALDIVADAMAADPGLGIVFPENDFLMAWEKNRQSADMLARRIGLPLPLPEHFEFPVGTMFWARPPALQPLIDADLQEADMPPEPVPVDGTILHALERLFPIVAEAAGYRYATTYIQNIRR
jgi:glycosyltransferase involved in cell wall biosynthesis